MILETRAVPPFYKNGFVVACERTREGILIDPGDEVDELLAAVRDADIEVRAILLTHAHVDHITGVDRAKSAFDVPVYLHPDDLFLYEHVVEEGARFGFRVQPQPPIDIFYDLTPLYFGDYEVAVHHTPGHCPGGVCLQVGRKGEPGRHLFVGDTLFAGSIGRTDLPGGSLAQELGSISDRILSRSDDAGVLPGHGPSTTVGAERSSNPFLTAGALAQAQHAEGWSGPA